MDFPKQPPWPGMKPFYPDSIPPPYYEPHRFDPSYPVMPYVPSNVPPVPPTLEEEMRMEGQMVNEQLMMTSNSMLPNSPLVPQMNVEHIPKPPDEPQLYETTMDYSVIDSYIAAEIASIVHTLTTSQLTYILAAVKNFAQAAPVDARRFLANNPQLTYALLHIQFVLGYTSGTCLPLSGVDMDLAVLNRGERGIVHPEPEPPLVKPEPEAPAAQPNYEMTHQEAAEGQPASKDIVEQQMVATQKETSSENTGEAKKPQTVEDLLNMGILPASAILVEEVLKNREILTK